MVNINVHVADTNMNYIINGYDTSNEGERGGGGEGEGGGGGRGREEDGPQIPSQRLVR